MSIPQATSRIGAVLAIIGATVTLVASAQASTAKPTRMSQSEYRALMIRSEALNRKYGLGQQRAAHTRMTAAEHRALKLRSEALNRKYGLGPNWVVHPGMTAAEHRALMLRSEALNRKYGLGGSH